MTAATSVSGSSSVTLSNPIIAIHDDGNVVTAIRSDINGAVNINVGTDVADSDLQNDLNKAALQLAQQNAVAAALVQTNLTGTASSDHGTSTVTMHPFYAASNLDGLAVSYTLTSVQGQSFNQNVGICGGPDQTDIDAFAVSVNAILQPLADAAALAARTAADAQVGISGLSGTGEASVTIG